MARGREYGRGVGGETDYFSLSVLGENSSGPGGDGEKQQACAAPGPLRSRPARSPIALDNHLGAAASRTSVLDRRLSSTMTATLRRAPPSHDASALHAKSKIDETTSNAGASHDTPSHF